jgi:hypothetical protein
VKVAELIALLQTLPPDMPVYTGCNEFYSNFENSDLRVVTVRNHDEAWIGLMIPDYETPLKGTREIDEYLRGEQPTNDYSNYLAE